MKSTILTGVTLCLVIGNWLPSGWAQSTTSDAIPIDRVFLALDEQVDVAARESGILATMSAREGQAVVRGDLLGTLSETKARLALEHAEVELKEADKLAQNNLKVKLAQKKTELAQLELRRALDSREKLKSSVSESEVDRLKLELDQAELEVDQAKFELQTLQLAVERKQNEVRVAEHNLERRRILAPLGGLIVEVKRHGGEWVEGGQAVLRLVRLDVLRADGLVAARYATLNLVGRPVELEVDLGEGSLRRFTGKVTFVSPEINNVSGQTQIRAEIPNPQLLLKPGMPGKMRVVR